MLAGGLLAVVLLAGCGGGGTTTVVQTVTVAHTTTVHVTVPATTTAGASNECTGDAMSGTFAVVPGSPGAGQIVYTLTVKNTSPTSCYVTGLPDAQLIGSNGADLPTHVIAEQAGEPTSAKITLAPGGSASADARFSPDVAGTGDQTSGPCEPVASKLRVGFGGAPLDVAISPPTSVCERGQLQFKVFSAS